VIEPIIAFVSANINSPNWKSRYSSLIALGAITEGPEKQRFAEIIVPGLSNLINIFTDKNAKVREAIAWVIARICEHHADVISNA
jgi:importin subunit beta-1